MQVAHFLEADLRPWGKALASALFARDAAQQPAALGGSAPAAHRDSAWQVLDDLTPLHGTVDAVLREWRGRLLDQLRRAPAEWQPALIGAKAIGGWLGLTYHEAAACCDAMHAVRGVESLCFHWSDALPYPDEPAALTREAFDEEQATAAAEANAARFVPYPSAAEAGAQRACTAVAALSTLRGLEVGGETSVFGAIAHALAPALPRLTQLHTLQLYWGDDDLGALAQPLGLLTTLTRLRLCIETQTSSALVLAPAFTCLCRLADLELSAGVGPGEVTALGPALGTLTTLTALQLRRSGGASDGEELEGVDGYDAAQELALGLRQLSRLAALDLASTFGCTGGTAALAPALGQLAALTGLNLSKNWIDEDDAAVLAPALSRLSRLAVLDLGWNELGADAAAALAPSIALLTALTRLHLDGNDVDADGAAALAPALSRLSRLVQLELGSNAIGADGAAALAPPLGRLTALTALHLASNAIGDEGLQQLAPALSRLTRLQKLALGLRDTAEHVKSALRARLPASCYCD